jgi:DNA-binding transcriptional ArsR family regulator
LAYLASWQEDCCQPSVLDPKTRARLARRALIVKALAHPSRLLILDELLRHGERCVCELTKLVGADMSTVSRHLGVLRVAGIVIDEKRGLQVFYRLRSPEVQGLVRATEDMAGAITRDQVGQLMNTC